MSVAGLIIFPSHDTLHQELNFPFEEQELLVLSSDIPIKLKKYSEKTEEINKFWLESTMEEI